MRPLRKSAWLMLGVLSGAGGCEPLSAPGDAGSVALDEVAGDSPNWTAWGTPVNLGPAVNTSADELQPAISHDGLSLFFRSDRPGGSGGADLWVSHRPSVDAPWQPPANLGPVVNSAMTEQSPFLSPDGHRLFFDSDRAGGCGGPDLYVSRRRDGHDDLGWSPPVNLGCVVNTEIRESGASFFEDENTGLGVLFFVREPGAIGGADIYVSHEQADGRFSAGVPVRELSSPFTDRFPRVTAAGLQILLSSNRPGGLGGIDTWISTRSTTDDAWSPPVNIGSPINTSFGDGTATLSARGDEMYFYSNRPGGLGGATFGGDLYVSARDRGGSP